MTINLFTCPVAATNKLNEIKAEWRKEVSKINCSSGAKLPWLYEYFYMDMCWQVATRYLLTSIQIEIVLLISLQCSDRQDERRNAPCGCVDVCVCQALCAMPELGDGRSRYVLIYRFYILSTHSLASGISLLLCFPGNCRAHTRVKSQIDRVFSRHTLLNSREEDKKKAHTHKWERSHIQKEIHSETLGNSIDDNAVLANEWRQRRCSRRRRRRRLPCSP